MIDQQLDRLSRAVRDVGFPIVVSSVLLYAFLVRAPQDVMALRQAIDRNTDALVSLQQGQQALLEAVRR